MKIKSLSVVFFLMFSVFIYTQDVNIISTGRVIINDTGSWHGEFKAEEHGFFIYMSATWKQRGANNNDEFILTFLDDYTPVITKSGMNTLTCEYMDIGWVWPNIGTTVSDSIDFQTAKMIFSTTLQSRRNGVHLNNNGIVSSWHENPSSSTAHITISTQFTKTISSGTSISVSESDSTNMALSGSIEILSLTSELTSTVTHQIENNFSISLEDSISFTKTLDAGPVNFNPDTQIAKAVVYICATEEDYLISYYSDENNNGLSDGEASTTVTVRKDIAPSFIMKIVNREELFQ